MTKTTEELKRAMYLNLPQARTVYGAEAFENALEEYLEALRQELAVSKRNEHNSEMAYKAAIEKQAELREELAESGRAAHLRQRIAFLTSEVHARANERDDLRNKLQAFEFANKSAGEMLQAANEKIKRQRQSIGQLKNERDNALHLAKVRTTQRDKLAQQLQEARKTQGASSVSDSSGNDPESILRSVQRNCQHSLRQQHEYPSGKLQSECIFCLKVEG